MNNTDQLAKKIILQFVRDNFDSDTLNKVENKINEIEIIYKPSNFLSNGDGYIINDKIYLDEKLKNYDASDEWGLDKKLETIIHEYGHALRNINNSYGHMLEEGFVNVFAHVCIIYNKSKNNKEKEVYSNVHYNYQKAEHQVKAILNILHQKEENLDIKMLGEYIFGTNKKFLEKCTEIFGEDFIEYFSVASSSEMDHNDKNYLNENISEQKLVKLLSDYMKNNSFDLKEYFSKNFLYSNASNTIVSSVIIAGKENFNKYEKEYELIQYEYDYNNKQNNLSKENYFEEVKKEYDIDNKDSLQIYNIITGLCRDYTQLNQIPNNKKVEEIKKFFPNIDEFSRQFKELNKIILLNHIDQSTIYEGIENITYENIESITLKKTRDIIEQLKKENEKDTNYTNSI